MGPHGTAPADPREFRQAPAIRRIKFDVGTPPRKAIGPFSVPKTARSPRASKTLRGRGRRDCSLPVLARWKRKNHLKAGGADADSNGFIAAAQTTFDLTGVPPTRNTGEMETSKKNASRDGVFREQWSTGLLDSPRVRRALGPGHWLAAVVVTPNRRAASGMFRTAMRGGIELRHRWLSTPDSRHRFRGPPL